MITVRKTTVAEIEASPNFSTMLEEYATEAAAKKAPPYCPQLEMYQQWENAGTLYIIGVFAEDVLVGFVNLLKAVLPHWGVLAVVTESLFVLQAYRKTGAGTKLIDAAKNYISEVNAFGALITAPVGGTLAEILLQRDDCEEVNRVFFMRVRDV